MNCQEVKEKLSCYIENDLPEGEKAAIQQHLSGCPSCREELDSLSKTINAVKQLPEIEAPAGFSTRVMARVREVEAKKTDSGKFFPFFGFRGTMREHGQPTPERVGRGQPRKNDLCNDLRMPRD